MHWSQGMMPVCIFFQFAPPSQLLHRLCSLSLTHSCHQTFLYSFSSNLLHFLFSINHIFVPICLCSIFSSPGSSSTSAARLCSLCWRHDTELCFVFLFLFLFFFLCSFLFEYFLLKYKGKRFVTLFFPLHFIAFPAFYNRIWGYCCLSVPFLNFSF